MRAVVVLADSSDGTALGVREVIRDWTAVGLLSDSFWFDPAEPAASTTEPPAMHLQLGKAEPCLLFDALAAAEVTEVCLLALATGQRLLGSGERARSLSDQMVGKLGGGAVDRRLVVIPQAGDEKPHGGDLWLGWHTYALLPEDSGAPLGFFTSISAESPPGYAVGHVASGLASLSGMWADTDPPSVGATSTGSHTLQAVRVFVRRFDAGPAVDAMEKAVLDARGRSRVGPDWRVEGPEAAGEAARLVLSQNAELVNFAPPSPEPRPRPAPIGAWQAIKLLLTFLVTAIRAAPRRWLSDVSAAAATATATAVHEAVFGTGEDVGHVVTVAGHRAAYGRDSQVLPAPDEPSEPTPGQLQRLLALDPRFSIVVPPTGEQLWRMTRDVAFDLLDGGTAGPPRPGVLGQVAVLVDESAISPAPDERVGAGIDATDVYDLLHTREVTAAQLASSESSGRDGEREQLIAQIDASLTRSQSSFTSTIGIHLFQQLALGEDATRRLAESFAGDTATSDLAEWQAVNRQMKTVARETMLGLATAVMTGIVLAALPWAGWRSASIVGILLGLTVLGSALRRFVRLHRRYFQLEDRLRLSEWRARQGPLQLLHLFGETGRLRQLNRQASIWAKILADAVHRPMGLRPAGLADLGFDFGESVPLSVCFAQPVLGRTDEEVVARLRATYYRRGWLSELWEERQASALKAWGKASGTEEVGNPLADQLDRLDGPARALAASAADPARLAVNDTIARARAKKLLDEGAAAFPLTRLVPIVSSHGHEQPTEKFVHDVLVDASESRHFSSEYFSPAAQVMQSDLTKVEHSDQLLSRGMSKDDLLLPEVTLAARAAAAGPTEAARDRRWDVIIVRIDYSVPTEPENLRMFAAHSGVDPDPGLPPEDVEVASTPESTSGVWG